MPNNGPASIVSDEEKNSMRFQRILSLGYQANPSMDLIRRAAAQQAAQPKPDEETVAPPVATPGAQMLERLRATDPGDIVKGAEALFSTGKLDDLDEFMQNNPALVNLYLQNDDVARNVAGDIKKHSLWERFKHFWLEDFLSSPVVSTTQVKNDLSGVFLSLGIGAGDIPGGKEIHRNLIKRQLWQKRSQQIRENIDGNERDVVTGTVIEMGLQSAQIGGSVLSRVVMGKIGQSIGTAAMGGSTTNPAAGALGAAGGKKLGGTAGSFGFSFLNAYGRIYNDRFYEVAAEGGTFSHEETVYAALLGGGVSAGIETFGEELVISQFGDRFASFGAGTGKSAQAFEKSLATPVGKTTAKDFSTKLGITSVGEGATEGLQSVTETSAASALATIDSPGDEFWKAFLNEMAERDWFKNAIEEAKVGLQVAIGFGGLGSGTRVVMENMPSTASARDTLNKGLSERSLEAYEGTLTGSRISTRKVQELNNHIKENRASILIDEDASREVSRATLADSEVDTDKNKISIDKAGVNEAIERLEKSDPDAANVLKEAIPAEQRAEDPGSSDQVEMEYEDYIQMGARNPAILDELEDSTSWNGSHLSKNMVAPVSELEEQLQTAVREEMENEDSAAELTDDQVILRDQVRMEVDRTMPNASEEEKVEARILLEANARARAQITGKSEIEEFGNLIIETFDGTKEDAVRVINEVRSGVKKLRERFDNDRVQFDKAADEFGLERNAFYLEVREIIQGLETDEDGDPIVEDFDGERLTGIRAQVEIISRTQSFQKKFGRTKIKGRGETIAVGFHGTLHNVTNADGETIFRDAGDVPADNKNYSNGGWAGSGVYATTSSFDAGSNYANPMGPDTAGKVDRNHTVFVDTALDIYEEQGFAAMLKYVEEMTGHTLAQLQELGLLRVYDSENQGQAFIEDISDQAFIEFFAMNVFGDHGGVVIPLIFNIENPFVMGKNDDTSGGKKDVDIDETIFDLNDLEGIYDAVWQVADELDRQGWEIGPADEFVAAVAETIGADIEANGVINGEDFFSLLRGPAVAFGAVYDQNGNMGNGEFARRVVEAMGFDGVVDHNPTRWNMKGVTPQTSHITAFYAHQVKSPYNSGEFSSTNGNIMFDAADDSIISSGVRKDEAHHDELTMVDLDSMPGETRRTAVKNIIKNLDTGYAWFTPPKDIDVEELLSRPTFSDEKSPEGTTGFKVPTEKDLEDIDKVLEEFIRQGTENLTWLHNKLPESFIESARNWYRGANAATKKLAERYDITHQQAAGITAALSPQNEWNNNMANAERIMKILNERTGEAWSDEMTARAKAWFGIAKKEIADLQKKIDAGTAEEKHHARLAVVQDSLAMYQAHLSELSKLSSWTEIEGDSIEDTDALIAFWVRMYDEANFAREHRVVLPSGEYNGVYNQVDDNGDLKQDEEGNPIPSKVKWGSFREISNAVRIFLDGENLRTISEALGKGHKVRSFYNNIINPDSEHFDVTIDTHAVGGGGFIPVGTNSTSVLHNFQGSGGSHGQQGTYPIWREVYKRYSEAVGFDYPREGQSVAWEAIRSVFHPGFKKKKGKGPNGKQILINVHKVNEIWKQAREGEITKDEAREQIFDLAGGFTNPAWQHETGEAVQSSGDSTFAKRPSGSRKRWVRASRRGVAERRRGLAERDRERKLAKATRVARDHYARPDRGKTAGGFTKPQLATKTARKEFGEGTLDWATWAIHNPNHNFVKAIAKGGHTARPYREFIPGRGGEFFAEAFDKATPEQRFTTGSVDLEDQSNRTFLSEDGTSGFVVTQKGELVAAFSIFPTDFVPMAQLAVAVGARKAVIPEGPSAILADLAGFRAVARVEDGESDNVYFVRDQKHHRGYDVGDGKRYANDEQARRQQQQWVRKVSRRDAAEDISLKPDSDLQGQGPSNPEYLALFDTNEDESIEKAADELEAKAKEVKGSEAYGAAQVIDAERTIIALSRKGDGGLPTLIHELGHVHLFRAIQDAKAGGKWGLTTLKRTLRWLEKQDAVKNHPDLPDKLNLHHLINGSGTPDGVNKEIETLLHELFADGYLKYIQDPSYNASPEMLAVYKRFSEFIFEHLGRLAQRLAGIELDDDIREVYSEILGSASDLRLSLITGSNQAMSQEALGLTDKQYEVYLKTVEKAHAEATRRVANEETKKLEKALKAEYRNDREAHKRRVRLELANEEPYATILSMQGKRVNERGNIEDTGAGITLDLATLKERYGNKWRSIANKLARRGLGHNNEGGIVAKEGGRTDLDLVAEYLGSSSFDDLMGAITNTPAFDDVVNLTAKERHEAEEGTSTEFVKLRLEEAFEGDVQESNAARAYVNDEQARVLIAELQALNNVTGKKKTRVNMAQIREKARLALEGKRLRDLNPNRYMQRMISYGQQAAKAAGQKKHAEAANLKAKQIVMRAYYLEARGMRTRAERSLRRTSWYAKQANRAKLQAKHRRLILQIQAQFGLRNDRERRRDNRPQVSRSSVSEIIAEAKRDGLETGVDEVHAALLEKEVHFKELTVPEFELLVNIMDSIKKLGLDKPQVENANGDKVDHAEAVAELVAALEENQEIKKGSRTKSKVVNFLGWGVDKVLGEFGNRQSEARIYDGKDAGTWWDYIITPIQRAEANKIARLTKAWEDFQDIMEKMPAPSGLFNSQGQVEVMPGWYIDRQQLIGFGLNWGNKENRARLLGSENVSGALAVHYAHQLGVDAKSLDVTSEQIAEAFFDAMDDSEWDVIQEVWDFIDQYWDESIALEERVTGAVPRRVDRLSFRTKTGRVMSGGYYPIVYDRELSDAKEIQMDPHTFEGLGGMTNHSHLEARATGPVPGHVLSLELSNIAGHIHKVIHDLTHREAHLQVIQLLNDKDVQKAITQRRGSAEMDAWRRWADNVRTGVLHREDGGWARIVATAKGRTSLAMLGLNLNVILLQPFGITNTASRLGGAKHLQAGLELWRQIAADGDNRHEDVKRVRDWIDSKSATMADRKITQNRELYQQFRELNDGKGLSTTQNALFGPVAYTQRFVDTWTWLSAYAKMMNETGGDDAVSSQFADTIVQEAQGSGNIGTLSTFMGAGNEFKQVFAMFMTFTSTIYNIARIAGNDAVGPKGTAAKKFGLLSHAFYLSLLPQAAQMILLEMMMKGHGPDDDEEMLPWMAKTYAKNNLAYVFSSTPVSREMFNSVITGLQYRGATGTDFIGSFTNGAGALIDALPGGDPFGGEEVDWDEGMVDGITDVLASNDFNAIVKMLSVAPVRKAPPIPASQIRKFLRGANEIEEGDADTPFEVIQSLGYGVDQEDD